MKKIISLFVVWTLLCSFILPTNVNFTAYADENVVEVLDYNLRRGLLEALNHKNGTVRPVEYQEVMDAVFTKEQLKELEVLGPEVCASHNNQEYTLKISDLTGIEHCVNLVTLSLVNQRITNISPLSNLVKLTKLDLRNNELSGVPITDISPITNLVELEELNLSQSKITDVLYLSNLHKMKKLNLMGTKIDNIDFIKNMPNLEYVDLSLNRIYDVTALKDAKNLTVIRISDNPDSDSERKIEDISILANLKKLEELHIANHKISDISVLKNFPYLKFIDVQENDIENLEPLLMLNNLSTVWVRGNKEGLDNNIANYKKAKELFAKLNKEILTRTDIATIDELISSESNIKNYFANSTISKLNEIKNELAQVETVENHIFDYLKTEKISGNIVSLDSFDEIKIEQGKGLEAIKNLLPKFVMATIEKAEEEIKGKVEYDAQETEILSIALVDKDGKLVEKELEFVSSFGNKVLKSSSGFLKIGKSDVSSFNWVNTKFELRSNEYKLEKEISIAKTTPTRLRFFNDVDYSALSNEEFEKKLVVILLDKAGSDAGGENNGQEQPGDNGGNENPGNNGQEQPGDNGGSENPSTPNEPAETLGVKGDKVYYKVVDTKGNKITSGVSFKAKDSEGFTIEMRAEQDGDYFVFKSDREDYEYVISIVSENYQLAKAYKFETSYRDIFKKFTVDGETKKVQEITGEESLNKFFTIIVKSTNEEENGYSGFRVRSLSFALGNNFGNSPLQENIQKEIAIDWNISNLEDKEGEYILTGELLLEDGITNTQNLKPTIKVIITEKANENQGGTGNDTGNNGSTGGNSSDGGNTGGSGNQGGTGNGTGNNGSTGGNSSGSGNTGGSGSSGTSGGSGSSGSSNSGMSSSSGGSNGANKPSSSDINAATKVDEKSSSNQVAPTESAKKVIVKAEADLVKIRRGEAKAFIKDGRLMLQLKYLGEVLGLNIKWNQKDKIAELSNDNIKADILIKEAKLLIDDKKENAKVIIINGRIYISISDISKVMTKDKALLWNNSTKELEIMK